VGPDIVDPAEKTALSAGYVTNTSFEFPAKDTAVPPVLDSRIVSRERVVPLDV
jgi:hypothetical protein